MKPTRGTRGEGRTGCILWLTFAALVAYGLYKVVPAKVAIGKFADAMQEQATFAASHGNPQIINELLEKAKDLEIPMTKENLAVTRTRESITIEVHGQLPVEFFGGLWTWVMPVDRIVARPLVMM